MKKYTKEPGTVVGRTTPNIDGGSVSVLYGRMCYRCPLFPFSIVLHWIEYSFQNTKIRLPFKSFSFSSNTTHSLLVKVANMPLTPWDFYMEISIILRPPSYCWSTRPIDKREREYRERRPLIEREIGDIAKYVSDKNVFSVCLKLELIY